ncbi:hypothetical protein VFPPC_02707 [Pochonia chlamydosporia 170]|uniref:Alkbh6 protein n=1 Tax=Pochonia chlamydosporia 170 TaxID=1380566 RepID=A0A179FYS1_METCM|nr:hypothetical protein VFPPC_02707 [Pochonia chlamydosporia 170]OAQ70203.1 hypothetical protein VFPPC_02707 [Pochonia chlamydosporia 170]
MAVDDHVATPPALENARIKDLPSTAYYISNFITEEEERIILSKIAAAPKPRWKQLTHRRLQTWPSELVQNRLLESPLPSWLEDPVVPRLLSLSSAGRSDLDLMPNTDSAAHTTADDVLEHVFAGSPHERPNHVLINEYPPGDGAAYWPVVCTVSLGASLCLDLHQSKEDGALDPVPTWRILQEPRSLLITTDKLYTEYLHGIADIEEDMNLSEDTIVNWSLLRDRQQFADGRNIRQTRTSLTYRDVLKVSKIGNRLSMFSTR